MKASPFFTAGLKLAVLALFVATFLAVFVPVQTAQADPPDNDQNVLISSDGEVFRAEQVAVSGVAPFHGSGVQPERTSEVPLTGKIMTKYDNPESVIGSDGRVRVANTANYPYRAIASLVMTFSDGQYICTGWFIGARTLATAGHCVFDPSKQEFASKIVVYPGRDGNTLPYDSAQASKLFTTTCWKNTASHECDYGAIKINKDLGNTVGWFGFGYNNNDNAIDGTRATVSGYPGDKPSGTQWKMKKPIKEVTTKNLWYAIDTYGGQSGSPIYGKFNFGFVCQPCGAGIHAYGTNLTPYPQYNSGTRITQAVFNALCKWRGGC